MNIRHTNPRTFFEEELPHVLDRRNGDSLPEDVVVAFHIEGTNGGSWQVARSEGPAAVGPVVAGPKDCEVRCNADDFMDLVFGRRPARELFFSGRLQIVGDIGLAMRLARIIPRAA